MVIGDVEIFADEGNDFVPGCKGVDDSSPELASRTGDGNPHHGA
jgi:hypothetical protein